MREILATDYSAEMVAIATAKGRAQRVSNVRFERRTPSDAALTAASFDVVMAMNFLHLLDDVPAGLRRVHELVRPGGLFISKTPCVGDQGLAVRVAVPLMRAVGLAPQLSFVTEPRLMTGVADAGFEVLETGMYPQKSRSLFIVARKP